MVAFLDIRRTAFGLAFEICGDVGDHDLERPPQPLESSVDRPRAESRPGVGLTETDHQVIAAARHLEGHSPDLLRVRRTETVGLDELLDSGP